jgi:hypothetical protein
MCRLDAVVIDGLRPDNPATPIRRELRKRAGRRRRDNFASMPYGQVPAFAKRLRAMPGNSPRCLEFAILTAARTSETLTTQWTEFDWQAQTGTVPAAKMKCRERHVVFLSDRALEILDGQAGQSGTFVFPSPRNAEAPMSNMSLLMTLRRLGVEAVRSIAEALPHVAPERAAPQWGGSVRGLPARSVSGAMDGRLKRPHAYIAKTDRAKSVCESGIRHASPASIFELVEMRPHVRGCPDHSSAQTAD